MVVLGDGGGFIFEDMVLWVFVSEDGGFEVFLNEDAGLGCEREGVEKRMGTLGDSKCVPERFYESQRERDRSRRGVPRENSWYIVPICVPQVTLREQTEQRSIVGWSENNFFFEIGKSVVLKTCQTGKIYEKNWFWRVAIFGGLATPQNVF